LFVGYYRLWAKCRTEYRQQWEAANSRSYFANSATSACEDVVWRQAARAEAAVGLDEEACSALWDMRAFYEKIPIWLLIQAGQATGVEPAVIKVCSFAYKCGRHLSLGGLITRALFAVCGMPAGCPWATMWVKVIMIRETDKLVMKHPRVVLDFFIDDLNVGSTGKKGQVANVLVEAARDLQEVIVIDWHSDIAADKGFVVASNQKLASELRGRLGI